MGYQEALEAAGHEIYDMKHFGEYQGEWIAITKKGQVILGSYGSCDHCDAYESAMYKFSYNERESEEFKKALKEFGQGYEALSYEDALGHSVWDMNSSEAKLWLQDTYAIFLAQNSEQEKSDEKMIDLDSF